MFDRAELEIAIGVTLAAAILLGWLLHALWRRLSPVPTSHAGRMAVMARRLHEAEEARDAAIEARLSAETAVNACTAEHQRAMADLEARIVTAAARREAELERALRAMTADRDASMDGLRQARARIAELEAGIPATGDSALVAPAGGQDAAEGAEPGAAAAEVEGDRAEGATTAPVAPARTGASGRRTGASGKRGKRSGPPAET